MASTSKCLAHIMTVHTQESDLNDMLVMLPGIVPVVLRGARRVTGKTAVGQRAAPHRRSHATVTGDICAAAVTIPDRYAGLGIIHRHEGHISSTVFVFGGPAPGSGMTGITQICHSTKCIMFSMRAGYRRCRVT